MRLRFNVFEKYELKQACRIWGSSGGVTRDGHAAVTAMISGLSLGISERLEILEFIRFVKEHAPNHARVLGTTFEYIEKSFEKC